MRSAALAFLLLVLVGCDVGEVPKDRFDGVVAERDDATRQLAEALSEIERLRSELAGGAQRLADEAAEADAARRARWANWLADYDEAVSSLDPARVGDFFDEDAVYLQASSGVVARGRNAILVDFVAYWEGFTTFRTESEEFFATDDEIVFLWSGNATRTNGEFELVSGGTYIQLQDGLIISQVDYTEYP